MRKYLLFYYHVNVADDLGDDGSFDENYDNYGGGREVLMTVQILPQLLKMLLNHKSYLLFHLNFLFLIKL